MSRSHLINGTEHFSYSEFNISGCYLPVQTRSKIYTNFMLPLERARAILKRPIYVSLKSGYRSSNWELLHGRQYISEHQFILKGAVDLVFYSDLSDVLFEFKIFPRIIYYPNEGFIHCDYKGSDSYICAFYVMAADRKSMRLVKYVAK